MKIDQEPSGNIMLEFNQQEIEMLSKRIIQYAEDAHSSVLNLGYLINEAKFVSHNNFRQPAHPWESRRHGAA